VVRRKTAIPWEASDDSVLAALDSGSRDGVVVGEVYHNGSTLAARVKIMRPDTLQTILDQDSVAVNLRSIVRGRYRPATTEPAWGAPELNLFDAIGVLAGSTDIKNLLANAK